MSAPAGSAARSECGNCQHFEQGAAQLERELPLLRTLSSAYSSVRARDGLCRQHERYLSASALCAQHAPA